MQIHNTSKEYAHIAGRKLLNRITGVQYTIYKITEDRDDIYMLTNGNSGKAYRIYVGNIDTTESFHFSHFSEVIQKYGELMPLPPCTIAHKLRIGNTAIRFPQVISTQKWAKIHPELYADSTL